MIMWDPETCAERDVCGKNDKGIGCVGCQWYEPEDDDERREVAQYWAEIMGRGGNGKLA
jgi:hypothetical protein